MTISNQWKIAISIIVITLIPIYYFGVRELVALSYLGKAPEGFNLIIEVFYPRFNIEKHRFDLSFFLQKSDLVVWRTCSTLTILILFGDKLYTLIFNEKNASLFNFHFFRWALYISAPFYYWDWYIELAKLSHIKEFYHPILLLSRVFPQYPSLLALGVLFVTMVLANMMILANKFVRLSGLLFALIFIILQGLFLSFHKIDHGFATYIYCLMIFPWMAPLNRKEPPQNISLWPLQLIWLSITLSYFMSGMEKLTISGWHWISPENLKNYLMVNHTEVGLWVSKSDGLCMTIATLGICFQLGFILVFPYPKLLWIFVPAGILFHLITGILFQITGWLSPWQLVYIFFVDWEKIWTNLSSNGFLNRIINTKKG